MGFLEPTIMKESYSINIIGTITTDVELRTTQSGKNYTRFTVLITGAPYIDKRTNEERENKTFFNITAWNEKAKNICEVAIKGKQIKLSCRRSLNTYTNKNGATVNDWNITADTFEMVDAASETPQTAATATKEVKKNEVPQGGDDLLPF